MGAGASAGASPSACKLLEQKVITPETVEAFEAKDAPGQKQMLGEVLYVRIEDLAPGIGGKITGMLLELDDEEILSLIATPELLRAKIVEAGGVLTSALDQGQSLLGMDTETIAALQTLRNRDAKELERIAAANEAIGKIQDDTIRAGLSSKQLAMFTAMQSGDEQAMQSAFSAIKLVAAAQEERCGALLNVCMAKYAAASVRYGSITEIEDRRGAKQRLQPVPTAEGDPERTVQMLLAAAAWHEPHFRATLTQIVQEFNAARSAHELVALFSLDASKFGLDFSPSFALGGGGGDGARVRVAFGPPKGFARALAKHEAGKSLKDLNRCTLEFEDPYALAMMYGAVATRWVEPVGS